LLSNWIKGWETKVCGR